MWYSRKQATVTLSLAEAELHSYVMCSQEAMFMNMFFGKRNTIKDLDKMSALLRQATDACDVWFGLIAAADV